MDHLLSPNIDYLNTTTLQCSNSHWLSVEVGYLSIRSCGIDCTYRYKDSVE